MIARSPEASAASDVAARPERAGGPALAPHVVVGGMKVATLSLETLIARMVAEAPAVRRAGVAPKLIFSANAHSLSLCATNPDFRAAMDQADLTHADGGVIVAASRLVSGAPIENRSATTDMFLDSFEAAARAGTSYYLLGATEDTNAECARLLAERHPGLKLAGRRNGYFAPEEEDAVIDAINAAAPDVLWIGLGKPAEQIFSVRNRNRLTCGWIVSCGGAYNFLTGEYPRAPHWMRRCGLEWLHRLSTKPGKLFMRYLITNPHALWLILTRHSRDVFA